MPIGIILVIVGALAVVYCLLSRRLPLLTVAATLLLAGFLGNDMSSLEWWVFAFTILTGLALTWPKNWSAVSSVRQWVAGGAVFLLTILMVQSGNLFATGYGWGWLLAFIAIILTAIGSKVIAIILAILAVLVMISTWGWLSWSSPSPTTTPSATATASATPSPSTTPTGTSTSNPVKELRATAGSVIGWDNVTTLVKQQDAAWFSQLIDDNQSKLGFNWDNVTNWSKARMSDGNAVGARVIVVFGADKSDIGDKTARKLVGLDKAKDKDIPIVRATGCYTQVSDNGNICPTSDQRVVVVLAPVVKVDGTIKLRTDSGVVLVPSDDGKVVLTPATYVAK